jgi:putative FmdB family regulatory protein
VKEVMIVPTYEYRCLDCDHKFIEVLTVSEHEKHKAKCPKCKSEKVEQVFSDFYAKTSRKA